MSTATIKAALRGIYEAGTADEVARAQKAMREVEAIEAGAKDVARTLENPFAVPYEQWARTCDLFKSIAKDAP